MILLFRDRATWQTILAMLHTSPGVARGSFGSTGSDRYTSILTGIRRETGADDGRTGILHSLADLPSRSATIATDRAVQAAAARISTEQSRAEPPGSCWSITPATGRIRGASASPPARDQGPGSRLPGPDAGHPCKMRQ